MGALAEASVQGKLSSFSGLFGSAHLSDVERENLRTLLEKFAPEEETQNATQHEDLSHLIAITSEVRAIHNQAVILHGQRIKSAQDLLRRYRDGAFSAWLIATYGNRQTPYNFLQYYEFYTQLPQTLHPQLEAMPRQVVYALASRSGDLQQKEEIVRNYKEGETKESLLTRIRQTFPLAENDGRRENSGNLAAQGLQRLINLMTRSNELESQDQRRALLDLLEEMRKTIHQCKVKN